MMPVRPRYAGLFSHFRRFFFFVQFEGCDADRVCRKLATFKRMESTRSQFILTFRLPIFQGMTHPGAVQRDLARDVPSLNYTTN